MRQKSVDLPLRLGAASRGSQGTAGGHIIGEYGLAAIAAVDDVIHGTRISRRKLASPCGRVPGNEAFPSIVKKRGTDPF